VLDAATLGTYEAGTTEEATPTTPRRAANGSRTRAKAPAASEAGV
ncbi:MAG: hypothetical protein H0W98_08435, partial [Chloroflexi bacterium]|nr:hypothetical protein [Chloroflexota bacterium]